MIRIPCTIIRDPEFWFISVYNIGIIALYLSSGYDSRIAIWGYYFQSLFIGVQYVGLSTIQKYKATGSLLPLKKHNFTLFFIAHFGLFHFVYFIFLLTLAFVDQNYKMISLLNFLKMNALVLALHTILLFGRELIPQTPNYPKPSVLKAYVRIIPIHLLIILAMFDKGNLQNAFIVFMILKLLMDLGIYTFSAISND